MSEYFLILICLSCLMSYSVKSLFIIIIAVIIHDVVEAELIHALAGRDNTKPIAELLLLQVLLGTAMSSAPLSSMSYKRLTGTLDNDQKTPDEQQPQSCPHLAG
jgi:hypothetical protein